MRFHGEMKHDRPVGTHPTMISSHPDPEQSRVPCTDHGTRASHVRTIEYSEQTRLSWSCSSAPDPVFDTGPRCRLAVESSAGVLPQKESTSQRCPGCVS